MSTFMSLLLSLDTDEMCQLFNNKNVLVQDNTLRVKNHCIGGGDGS